MKEYTDRIESFGIDECWLDVTCTRRDIKEVADEIRETVKKELGITVSVGASFNKIFAKLGSDMKKPDATTVITRDNFRERIGVFPLLTCFLSDVLLLKSCIITEFPLSENLPILHWEYFKAGWESGEKIYIAMPTEWKTVKFPCLLKAPLR